MSGIRKIQDARGVTISEDPSKATGIQEGSYIETSKILSPRGGALILDLKVLNFEVLLNQDIAQISFVNLPELDGVVSATVKFQADGTLRTITYPSPLFKWANGTPPTMTSTAGKFDILIFSSWNKGATWFCFNGGQNF